MKRSEKIFAPEDFIMQECLKSNNIFQHLFNIFEGFFCYDRIYTMTRHEKIFMHTTQVRWTLYPTVIFNFKTALGKRSAR